MVGSTPSGSSYNPNDTALIIAALKTDVNDVAKRMAPPNFVDIVSKSCNDDVCSEGESILSVGKVNELMGKTGQNAYKKADLTAKTPQEKSDIHKQLVAKGFKVVICPQCRGMRHPVCSTAVAPQGGYVNGYFSTPCHKCNTAPEARWW